MASLFNIMLSVLLVGILFISTVTPYPGGVDYTKVKIHVPVKHHTHIHTKTIVKTVKVPIHIEHHEVEEHEEEHEYVPHHKKKRYHPFI